MDTPQKMLAKAERIAFDSRPVSEHSQHCIGSYSNWKDPTVSSRAVRLRSRLLLAGARADIFWEKIETGMPLTTAVNLLRESEGLWRHSNDGRQLTDVIQQVITRYESSGHARVVGDKVVRTRGTVLEREVRIATGAQAPSEAPGTPSNGSKARPRGAIREACGAWLASILPKDDPRVEQIAVELVREIDMVLESFGHRLRPEPVMRDQLLAACDLLNIPRPKWGRRADQDRAWKNRKAALRATHPDALGHVGGVAAFQAIKDAYDTVVSYNDKLPQPQSGG